MTTDYDPIAEQYQRAKQQPWRAYIEAYTLLGLVGDLSGRAVVDLACGEGFYSRLLRRKGADRVVGVDLSPRMIELARGQEAQAPLGVEYAVGDARRLAFSGEFDLAVAAYLLNYAASFEELQTMCDGVARCLKPGGRFVTVNCSPLLDFRTAPSYRKYGFEALLAGRWREGAPITWRFHLDDAGFEIENYFIDADRHEQAFRAAGFSTCRWHEPRLAQAGEGAERPGFWTTFLDHSPIAFIECVK